jgi:hypothetical protein
MIAIIQYSYATAFFRNLILMHHLGIASCSQQIPTAKTRHYQAVSAP